MRRARGEQPSANPAENTPVAPATPAAPATPEPTAPATTTETTATPTTTETPTAPATPAPEPEQPTSRPWYRNWPRRQPRRRELPQTEEGPLDREQNYSRAEEINQLVDNILSGSWEDNDRARVFEERYGAGRNAENGIRRTVVNWRAWLAGEYDMTYNQNTGQVDFNYQTEVLRRLATFGINSAQTGALMAAFGVITGGGAAIALGPSMVGSMIGRATGEISQAASGQERIRRERLIIARERYYKKALELASRVGREQPDFVDETNGVNVPWDQSSPEARANYEATRNAAVRDLVNFVHASEQNAVVFAQRRNGAYFNDTREGRISGPPLEAGGMATGEPRPGVGTGRTLNEGTEVYQPSEVAPDAEIEGEEFSAQRLGEMEKEFAEYRQRADRMKAMFSMVGGFAGGIFQVLAAKQAEFAKMIADLNDGAPVRLNINADGVWHAVQTRGGQIAIDAQNNATNLVYHLNNQLEAMRAAFDAGSAQVRSQLVEGGLLKNAGDIISHDLQTTMSQLVEAVNRQAWLEAGRVALGITGGLATQGLIERAVYINDNVRFKRNREIFEQQQENLRRREVPPERAVPIEELARQAEKPMPAVDQIWRIPYENDFEYIKILEVDQRPDRVVLTIRRNRPGERDSLIDRISAEQLLIDPWQAVIRGEGNPQPAPAAPGTPPPAAPAPRGPAPEPAPGGPNPPAPPAPLVPPLLEPEPIPPQVREQEREEDDDLSSFFDEAEREMEEEQRRPRNEQPDNLEQPENAGLPFKVNSEYQATNLRQLTETEKADYQQISGGRTFNDKLFRAEIDGRNIVLRFTDELPSDQSAKVVVDKIDFLKSESDKFELGVHVKKDAEPEPEENPEDENNFSEEAKKALREARDPFNSRNIWVIKKEEVKGSKETRPVRSIMAEKVEEPEKGLQKINIDSNKNYSITVGSVDEDGHTSVVITTEGLDLIAPIEAVRTAFELRSIRDCGDQKAKETAVRELIKAVYTEANKVKEKDEEPPQDPELLDPEPEPDDEGSSGASDNNPEQDPAVPVELEFVQLSGGEEIRPGFTITLYEDRSGTPEKQTREISKIYGGGGKIGVIYANGDRRTYSLEDLQKGLDNKVVEIIKP